MSKISNDKQDLTKSSISSQDSQNSREIPETISQGNAHVGGNTQNFEDYSGVFVKDVSENAKVGGAYSQFGDRYYNFKGSVHITAPPNNPSNKTDDPHDIELLRTNLIELLNKEASILAGTKDDLIRERNIQIAPLEITTESRDFQLIDQNGHFHHRREIADIFNKPPAGNIQSHELFMEAEKLANAACERNCDTKEAKERYKLVNGNIVGVIGHAGMGKTTLTKLLVKKILDKKLYNNVKYLFYLRFRDTNYSEKTNLLSFLTNGCSCRLRLSSAELARLLKIIDESQNVCIIMDGYDEAVIAKKASEMKLCRDVLDEAAAETFIFSILAGNILPRAKKLITSRPRQMLELSGGFKPKFTVNILGLNKAAQELICADICKNEEELTKKILDYLYERPDLKSYCYVPVNCIIIMHCICVNFQTIETDRFERMDSITTILVAALGLFIKNGHLQAEFQTQNLCYLAYTGFLDNRLYFEKKHIIKAGINDKNATAFLTTTIGSKLGLKLWEGMEKSKSYFSHFMIQEFFVSGHMKLYMEAADFCKSIGTLDDSRYQMITKFLFGLCNETTLDYLFELVSLPDEDRPKHEASTKQLQSLVLKQIKGCKDSSTLLKLSGWIYEMRDDIFTEKAAESLPDNVTLTGEILPSDVPGFHYLMRARKTPLCLLLVHPKFAGEGLKQHFVDLERTVQTTRAINSLTFIFDMGDEGISNLRNCILEVDYLRFKNCGITSRGVATLSEIIRERKNPLKNLDLEENLIGDEGAIELSHCLHNIEKVNLEFCSIKGNGVRGLAERIKHLLTPMKLLNLRENEIGNDGATSLADCIHKIEELQVEFCTITTSGAKVLAEKIQHRSVPMQHLAIMNNKIGDDGFNAIASCIEKIDNLSIGDYNDNFLSLKGIQDLAKAIEERSQPMDEIFLWCRYGLEESAKKAFKRCQSMTKQQHFQDLQYFENY